ncbi:hypothetical protein PO909_015130 [Leuciscus waleckii]
MNQDLLSGGSGSRAAQQQRPGAGNSTSGRTPQPQAEHVNQVLEEQEQEDQAQRREPGEEEEGRPEGEEEPWPSGGEPVEEGRRSEVNGAEKGAQWMWEQEQRRRRRRHRDDDEENEEEENNNGGRDGQVGAGLRSEEDDDRPEEEENGDEEEMDQDSDEFEHSEDRPVFRTLMITRTSPLDDSTKAHPLSSRIR